MLVLLDATVVGVIPLSSKFSMPWKYVAMDFLISNLLRDPVCVMPKFLQSRRR